MAAGKLLPYTKYLLYTAQTSGVQKGLHTFTVEQCQELKENNNQSGLNKCDSVDNGVQSFESETIAVQSEPQRLDSGLQSLENSYSILNQSVSLKMDQPTNVPQSCVLRDREQSCLSLNSSRTMSKAGEPKFLNEFYSNSRLHFLSTWKAEFKSYVNELQSKGDNFAGREELRKIVSSREATDEYATKGGKPKRCVMHVDMDCFFVSVGLRKRPDLKGKRWHNVFTFFQEIPGQGFNCKLFFFTCLIFIRRKGITKYFVFGIYMGRSQEVADI